MCRKSVELVSQNVKEELRVALKGQRQETHGGNKQSQSFCSHTWHMQLLIIKRKSPKYTSEKNSKQLTQA